MKCAYYYGDGSINEAREEERPQTLKTGQEVAHRLDIPQDDVLSS